LQGFCLPIRSDFLKFYVIGTHNPQDFFTGLEPDELVEEKEANKENLAEIVTDLLNGGYKVIVLKR
jgi:hypothetical protein